MAQYTVEAAFISIYFVTSEAIGLRNLSLRTGIMSEY